MIKTSRMASTANTLEEDFVRSRILSYSTTDTHTRTCTRTHQRTHTLTHTVEVNTAYTSIKSYDILTKFQSSCL